MDLPDSCPTTYTPTNTISGVPFLKPSTSLEKKMQREVFLTYFFQYEGEHKRAINLPFCLFCVLLVVFGSKNPSLYIGSEPLHIVNILPL